MTNFSVIKPTVVSNKTPGIIDPMEAATSRAEERYINSSVYTVYIKKRNGLIVTVFKTYNGNKTGELIIRRRQYLEKEAMTIARDSYELQDVDEHYFNSAKQYRGIFNSINTDTITNEFHREYTVDFVFNIMDMVQWSVYYDYDTDYLISLDLDSLVKTEHPSGTVFSEKESRNTPGQLSLDTSLTIVDNNNVVTTRFFQIAGRVVEVQPIKSPHRLDGVYLHYTDADGEDNEEYCGIEQSEEKFHLFKTREEAEHFGDMELAKMRLKYQATVEEIDTSKQSRALDLELKSSNHQYALREKEIDLLMKERSDHATARKLELEYRTESMSSESKVTIELLKMIPVVLTAGVLMYSALKKK